MPAYWPSTTLLTLVLPRTDSGYTVVRQTRLREVCRQALNPDALQSRLRGVLEEQQITPAAITLVLGMLHVDSTKRLTAAKARGAAGWLGVGI